jgi:hypothetical protein
MSMPDMEVSLQKVLSHVVSSGLDVAGQFTAIGGKLRHDLLVQPDIHRCGVISVTSIIQFLGELLVQRTTLHSLRCKKFVVIGTSHTNRSRRALWPIRATTDTRRAGSSIDAQ